MIYVISIYIIMVILCFPLPLSWFSLPVSTLAHIVTCQQRRDDEPMLVFKRINASSNPQHLGTALRVI